MSERFKSPFPPPTPFQRELLDVLAEECAEVIQRVTKMQRFGVEEVQPGQPHSNAQRLSLEVGDLIAMVHMAIEAKLIDEDMMHAQIEPKRKKFVKFSQINSD
jgi:NTP pyrophosphatase (non-canonical NTP hydrolase)